MSTPIAMQSIIFVSKNTESIRKKWEEICQQNQINPIDQIVIESEKALGIDDIRGIQKTIFLTPMKSKKKGIFLKNAQTLTLAAQNAFLKLLEEPPAHAVILLQTPSEDLLLPTILSRCTILRDGEDNTIEVEVLKIPSTERQRWELAAEVGKTKEEALHFLESQIIQIRKELLKDKSDQHATLLKSLQEAHTIISTTNVNPRFVLENTLLA